jgi:hypothetical protein
MFTDVVGYSALWQRASQLALELLEEHPAAAEDLLATGLGRRRAVLKLTKAA